MDRRSCDWDGRLVNKWKGDEGEVNIDNRRLSRLKVHPLPTPPIEWTKVVKARDSRA